MKKTSYLLLPVLAVLLVAACQPKTEATAAEPEESRQAKALLQGIWLDAETEEVSFRASGDTIFYPDSTSLPAYFRIVNDSLVLGSHGGTKYPIVKQSPYVFWFCNQNGDVVKLVKSDNPEDSLGFAHVSKPKVMTYTEVVKTDSVVMFGGERYHWYIAINPTKYRVTKKSYNDDGVGVDNVYYDNIMHISVFQGARKIYSSDFRKQMYADKVPAGFLSQAVLSNMEFDHVDAAGLHFNATLCIPDGASCYLVATNVSFDGQMSMKLVEN